MLFLPSSDACWHAVATRDSGADGQFVYAVRTTGVFCRPSCAARTPRRANVSFFNTPREAEAAGFRPCRRCRPGHPEGSRAEEVVAEARALLDTASAPLPLAQIAAEVGVSASYLQRVFKRMVGQTPRAYADARRMARVRAGLRQGQTVLEATFDAGFGSARALYEKAPAALGMTPGAYRRGGAGEAIHYDTFDTPLGALLLAATARGLCAATLGDTPEALETALRAEFPAADVARVPEAVAAYARPFQAYLRGEAVSLDGLPLDLRGTDFQQRVWALLQNIPPGETRTYGEVAAAMEQPTATRAVAQACGANRVALAVPCHRVVGAGGALRGYRWGPQRKADLLRLEREGVTEASPPSSSEQPGESR